MLLKALKTTILSLISCLLLGNFSVLLAQNNNTTALIHSAALIRVDYGVQLPAADMAKRFGINSCIGFGTDYKTSSNWLIGVEGRYLFGNQINEDSLAMNLATSDGYIVGESGLPAKVDIFERGWWAGIKIGKIFPVSPKRLDSGIFASLGLGYMQHHIRLQDLYNEVPQFAGDYVKGYDRLSGGYTISQTIGYMHLPNKGLRFFAALDCIEGFTKSLRDYNFDTRTMNKNQRLDLLFGLRLGWILPIYTGTATRDGAKVKEKRYYVD
jgi:hypothetical protein